MNDLKSNWKKWISWFLLAVSIIIVYVKVYKDRKWSNEKKCFSNSHDIISGI